MAALGCNYTYNQVLKKIKIVVRILSWMAVIMTKIWWNYDSLIHSETKWSTTINLALCNSSLNSDQS